MQQPPKTVFKFFLYFLRPHALLASGMLLTGFVWGMVMSLAPYCLKIIIDTLAAYEGDVHQAIYAVKVPALIYLGFYFITACNFRLLDWIRLKLMPAIRRDIMLAMFRYLKAHSYSYFQNHFAGSLANKVSDITGSAIGILMKFDELFACISAVTIASITLFIVHPFFAAILLSWTILFMSVAVRATGRTHELSTIFSESRSSLFGRIVDSITNAFTAKIFARSNFEIENVEEYVDKTVAHDRELQRYVLKIRIYLDCLIVLLIGAMLSLLLFFYSRKQVTLGDFALIMSISVSIFQSIWFLSSQFVQFSEEFGKASQALSILRTPHEILDREDATPLKIESGTITLDAIRFAYDGQPPLFDGLSINIAAGEKVGLVGYSGSGKTTLVNLILRFFELEAGTIRIDGQSIADVTQKSLHEKISLIPQDPSLFHRSLMENIRYGKLDADDKAVEEAARLAQCHDFIKALPEGYDTLVGERGIKLSGGQRQRIAIARALLKDAPIVILDEATSALDSVTERAIQDSLGKLTEGKTTLIIAHRLSTLEQVDRILVFDKGQLIESGSHAVLLEKDGHYARMWAMQSGGFLPDES